MSRKLSPRGSTVSLAGVIINIVELLSGNFALDFSIFPIPYSVTFNIHFENLQSEAYFPLLQYCLSFRVLPLFPAVQIKNLPKVVKGAALVVTSHNHQII